MNIYCVFQDVSSPYQLTCLRTFGHRTPEHAFLQGGGSGHVNWLLRQAGAADAEARRHSYAKALGKSQAPGRQGARGAVWHEKGTRDSHELNKFPNWLDLGISSRKLVRTNLMGLRFLKMAQGVCNALAVMLALGRVRRGRTHCQQPIGMPSLRQGQQTQNIAPYSVSYFVQGRAYKRVHIW